MKIIRANAMGYCMGVKYAIEKAEAALNSAPKKNVYTLGPLIHNKKALDVLSAKGLKILNPDKIEIPDAKNSIIVIRAHGISPKLHEKLLALHTDVIDATCPRVLSSHKRVFDFAQRGYIIIIAGDKNHAEVTGIQGVIEDVVFKTECVDSEKAMSVVIENEAQVDNINFDLNRKYVILSQTTFSRDEYKNIVDKIKTKISALTILNTICSATEERQCALLELCKECDVVFVIGSKESANTMRLFELAKNCSKGDFRVKKAFYVENSAEVDKLKDEIADNFIVGLTAGASTPEECVKEIEKKLLESDT